MECAVVLEFSHVCQTFVRSESKVTVSKVAGKEVRMTKATGRIEFCLRTQKNHPIYAAKIRAAREIVLPDCIVDPTYKKLIAATLGQEE